jgi:hypothetical protein
MRVIKYDILALAVIGNRQRHHSQQEQATHFTTSAEPRELTMAISIIIAIAIAAVDRLPTAYHGTAPADSYCRLDTVWST